MTQKTALITGITGQDGAYLSEFLLQKNYKIIGFQQSSATPNTENIDHLKSDIDLIYGDMCDGGNITNILNTHRPDEIYNLAGQSHVGESFDLPEMTTQINGLGVLRFLESIRILGLNTRFYQASTSEIFGNADVSPQTETTPLRAESPYAASKIYAHNMVDVYRKSYGLHASCGILFNHESPIRGEDFVTRKICQAVARIRQGAQDILELGNLDAKRDWGHAKDYVRGMWMMTQADAPDDYVLATGQSHSVRDFVTIAFKHIGVDIVWDGDTGKNSKTGKTVVKTNPKFYRPNDLHTLCGDASKVKNILGWEPEISFQSLISEMMESELSQFRLSNLKFG